MFESGPSWNQTPLSAINLRNLSRYSPALFIINKILVIGGDLFLFNGTTVTERLTTYGMTSLRRLGI